MEADATPRAGLAAGAVLLAFRLVFIEVEPGTLRHSERGMTSIALLDEFPRHAIPPQALRAQKRTHLFLGFTFTNKHIATSCILLFFAIRHVCVFALSQIGCKSFLADFIHFF